MHAHAARMALSARLGGGLALPHGHGASALQRCAAGRAAAVSLAPRALRARDASCLLLHARPARCCAHGAGMPRVLALDAAQPFDREALQKRRLDAERAAADKQLIGARAGWHACTRHRRRRAPRQPQTP